MALSASRRSSLQGGAPTPPPATPPAPPARWLRRLVVWVLAPLLLAIMVVGVIVAIEAQSLPDFGSMKSSQNGQTIVVRARDGTELVALGPSYGHWLSYGDIPQVMKDATVSVEDRRFRSHIGIDPIGISRSLTVRLESGHWRQGDRR